MKTFAIATLGCKVNAYESESYVQGLMALGYKEVKFKDRADVYIVNTCAVTNTAAAKSRQKINQAKKHNADALLCVVGCFVQTTTKPEMLDAHILIGSNRKHELPQLIEQALQTQTPISYIEDITHVSDFEELHVDHFEHRTRAFLKIQDGCNQFCSYCIIPYARGRERSMPLDRVIEQATKLVASGHCEIVLSGIHSGRYGKDLGISLLTLLEALVKIEQLKRIRISSIEVNEVSDELIAFIASHDKLAKHLHIPLQAGCDTILKAMNRPYTVAFFKQRIEYIRKCIPTISLSSDIILGFPNEREDEYLQTKQTLEELAFSFLHVFPFSQREGTKAAQLTAHVAKDIKKQRCQAISFLSKTHYNEYISSFVNTQVDVLFEYEKDGYVYGYTSEYVLTRVKADSTYCNQLCVVTITGVDDMTLRGSLGGF